MDIAVVGAGNVGSALARRFVALEHQVTFAARDPQSPRVLAARAAFPDAGVRSLADAVASADLVVLAVPGSAVEDAVRGVDLGGRVVMDATNPFRTTLPEGVASLAEAIATWAPGARVVKACNTTGSGVMADPFAAGDVLPVMPYCGDDAAAKDLVAGLIGALGFEPLDAGGLDAARLLEALAELWVHLAYGRGLGADIAYAVLRRGPGTG
ncbi:MAG TPA: NAD(P)-binding domain-containing protein [Acidimicrobiia bacterium]|nr:NAD(P)-binding domain-containing protein [Acidimicrobiia bacterium]